MSEELPNLTDEELRQIAEGGFAFPHRGSQGDIISQMAEELLGLRDVLRGLDYELTELWSLGSLPRRLLPLWDRISKLAVKFPRHNRE